MAVKRITLRAWSDNSDVAPIKINQGDILSRTIIMTLLDSGGTPIDLTLSTVRVHFSKPDGTVAYLTASIVNATAGIISVTLDSQCTAVPGTVKAIVQTTGPNGENLFFTGLTFAVGVVNIEESIISANEFTALTDALAQVQGIANKADKSTMINGHTLAESFNLKAADFSDVAGLDADGKVIKDPASYGKADGGAVLPHTLPTTAKLVQLLNGVLVPIDLPAEGTLLEVGPNNTLVSAESNTDIPASALGYLNTGMTLQKQGKVVVCLLDNINDERSYNGEFTIPGVIPAAFRPSRIMSYTHAVDMTTGKTLTFIFHDNGDLEIFWPTTDSYSYMRFGTFVWVTK